MINLNTVLDKVLNIDMLSIGAKVFLATIGIAALIYVVFKPGFDFVIQIIKDK